MKKYRNNYGLEIEEIEVIKETAHFVTIIIPFTGEKIERRVSSDNVYDSYDQAVNAIVANQQIRIDDAVRRLDSEQKYMQSIKEKFGLH